jgi:hypothetical protein
MASDQPAAEAAEAIADALREGGRPDAAKYVDQFAAGEQPTPIDAGEERAREQGRELLGQLRRQTTGWLGDAA